jgi:drug/metabolite transporter (DMT)-like permease
MLLGLGSALVAACLFGTGSIFQTIASRNVALSAGLSHHLVLGLLRQPIFLAALGVNLLGFAFHLIALRTIPLFLAQSGIAASLAVTALLAMRFFDDPLGTRDWTAVAAVCVGLALLALSAGDVGDARAHDTFVFGIFVALAAIAAVGLVISRFHGPLATAGLGLLAGFGFAGVSLASRLLPDLSPPTIVHSPATYALCASGGLAFLLYSLALQRGSVTGATGPMIVSQTVTPAVIGLLLLDDEIRSGWSAVAVVSFLVTGAGAVALARFEQAPDHRAVPVRGDDETGSATGL